MLSCNVYYDKEVVPPLKIDSFDEFNVNEWLSLVSIITLTTLIAFLSSLCRLSDQKMNMKHLMLIFLKVL
jgi:hypothetical protein